MWFEPSNSSTAVYYLPEDLLAQLRLYDDLTPLINGLHLERDNIMYLLLAHASLKANR